MKKGFSFLLFYCSLLFCFSGAVAFAEADTLITESKYFSIYSSGNVDSHAILKKVNFNYLALPESMYEKAGTGAKDILANTVDALYSEVSDILDIHIYSFHGTIKILPNQASLSALINQNFRIIFNEPSIYVHEKNTIYISLADTTTGMLGHEISHAIISHYFVVPPPAKIEEVLSGYVEYSLRKSRK